AEHAAAATRLHLQQRALADLHAQPAVEALQREGTRRARPPALELAPGRPLVHHAGQAEGIEQLAKAAGTKIHGELRHRPALAGAAPVAAGIQFESVRAGAEALHPQTILAGMR